MNNLKDFQLFLSLLKLQTNQKVTKPLVFITCGIHAREWVSPATCMYVIDQVRHRSTLEAGKYC